MSALVQSVITLAARVLLSQVFLLAAVNHLMNWAGTVGYIRSKGLSIQTPLGETGRVMAAAAVALMLVGGLSVLLGIRARWGAVLLIFFLISAALTFHDFWTYAAGDPQRGNQMAHFMKNIGLVGGLLMVVVYGSGRWSLDALWPSRPANSAATQ
jgi:putative oxidoreductase